MAISYFRSSDEDIDAMQKKLDERTAAKDPKNGKAEVARDITTPEERDASERAATATATAEPNATYAGDTIMRDAAGNVTGTRSADGTITPNADNAAAKSLIRDTDGNLRWENGKLAGARPKPNSDGAAKQQGKMDQSTDVLLAKLRQNNPNNYSDATLLENYAMQHNAKAAGGQESAQGAAKQDGPSVAVIGTGRAGTKRDLAGRILNADGTVAQGQQPKRFTSFEDAAKQQRAEEERARTAEFEQMRDAERTAYGQKKVQDAKRKDALGTAVKIALDGLEKNGTVKEGKNGRRYVMYAVSPGTLNTINGRWRENGGKSEYNAVIAYAEIDANGKTIGEPMVATRNVKDGQPGTKAQGVFRKWTMTDVETELNGAHRTLYGNGDAADERTKGVMGAYGSIGKGTGAKAGAGLEIAKLNAEQKEKDRAERVNNRKEQMAFKDKSLKLMAAKGLYKEAKELLTSMSDEDKEYFVKAYPDIAKQIIGDGVAPEVGVEMYASNPRSGGENKFITDKSGVKWEVVYGKDGKPVGKKRVK